MNSTLDIKKQKPDKKKMSRPLKRTIITLAALCLAGILTVGGINVFMIVNASDMSYDFGLLNRESEEYSENELKEVSQFGADCIIVLGAKVTGDRPSLMLEDRIIVGATLYNEGVSARLLMSGDNQNEDYNEVDVMKNYAVETMDSAEAGIEIDRLGLSTFDSLYRAREEFGCKRVIIVSQGFHLPRAIYIAQKLGIEAIGVDATLRNYRTLIKSDIRELAARVKDFGKMTFTSAAE